MTGRHSRTAGDTTGQAAAEARLRLARDSLADSRLLAERGRRNADLLLDLALRQALGAVSLQQGLDAPDGLDLDTLLRRVPSDHAASAPAGRLGDPRARDAAAVEGLIEAVSAPEPDERRAPKRDAAAPGAKPAAEPTGTGCRRTGRRMQAAGAEEDRPGTAPVDAEAATGPTIRSGSLADGPTAFETAARHAAADRPATVPDGDTVRAVASTAFWVLADRWGLSDTDALALLGTGRGLTAKGTRPRFSLRGADARRYGLLRRIDTALETLGETPDWLRRPRPEKPFNGSTPLQALLQAPEAAEAMIHALNRTGLQAALGSASDTSSRARVRTG